MKIQLSQPEKMILLILIQIVHLPMAQQGYFFLVGLSSPCTIKCKSWHHQKYVLEGYSLCLLATFITDEFLTLLKK